MGSTFLIAATSLTLMLGDYYELVRISPLGSYRVAYSHVRVLGPKGRMVAEAKTDRYGRIKFELPAGTYDAEVKDGNNTYRFKLTVSGSRTVTRIELK
jgi:hypothetical protein